MALRLIELLIAAECESEVDELLDECANDQLDTWRTTTADGRMDVRVLIEQQHTEQLLDKIEDRFHNRAEFRLVLSHPKLTLPRAPEPEPKPEATSGEPRPDEPPPPTFGWNRLSRQELLAEAKRSTQLDRMQVALVVLSFAVAAAGLLGNSVAIVIAAMVIAPLLGPNISLALATTTGDTDLARRSAWVAITSMLIALGLALATGAVTAAFGIDLMASDEIAARTVSRPGSDFVLAIAAGAAGALSFTSGVSGTLIGVMVAVALMPPLIVFGFLLAGGNLGHAVDAGLLLATNVIGVNLAAVITFLQQGIRPTRWWETGKAERATRRALRTWGLLLLILVIVMVMRGRGVA